jgi:hypothetical protein
MALHNEITVVNNNKGCTGFRHLAEKDDEDRIVSDDDSSNELSIESTYDPNNIEASLKRFGDVFEQETERSKRLRYETLDFPSVEQILSKSMADFLKVLKTKKQEWVRHRINEALQKAFSVCEERSRSVNDFHKCCNCDRDNIIQIMKKQSCGHSLCLECIDLYTSSSKDYKLRVKCPSCKAYTSKALLVII